MRWRDAFDELSSSLEVAADTQPSAGLMPDDTLRVNLVRGPTIQAITLDGAAQEDLELAPRDDADLRTELDRVPFRLAAREPLPGDRAMFRVYPITGRTQLDAPLAIGITEVSRNALQRWVSPNDTESVQRWLTEEFIIDASGDAYALIHPSGNKRSAGFELIGRAGLRARVTESREGQLRVERIRTHIGVIVAPVTLVESRVHFVDATTSAKLSASASAQLRTQLSSRDSYLGMWWSYLEADARRTLDRARKAGAPDYMCELSGDAFEFTLENEGAFLQVCRKGDGIVAQELDSTLPSYLQDSDVTEIPPVRGWFGEITRVDARNRRLTVKSRRDDAPPLVGTLLLSLAGDRARIDRQSEAWTALYSGQTAMAHLPSLLAGSAPPLPDVKTRSKLPKAAKRSFKQAPTSMQTNAVLAILNTPDVVLIQGPPGTGKTTVVVAAEAALAELEGEGTVRRGQTLLSGFQHVAVENLAERTARHDLPPLKLGSGEWSDNALLDWGRERVEKLDAWLELHAAENRTATHLSRRLQGVLRDPLAPDALHALLRDAQDSLTGIADADLLEDLARAEERAKTQTLTQNEDERRRLVRQVWALPITPEQWTDGGRQAFRRVRRAGAEHFSDDQRKTLDMLAQQRGRLPQGVELKEIRTSLLRALRPPRRTLLGDLVEPETWDTIQRAIAVASREVDARQRTPSDVVAELRDALALDLAAVRDSVARYSPSIAATLQQSVAKDARRFYEDDIQFRTVVIDEAARANPLDLLIPMVRAGQRIVLVGDHRQLPQMIEPEVLERMESEGTLAADAFPTESLFQQLVTLFQKKHDEGGPLRVVRLDKQFRMHPALGNFVSDTFYAPYDEGFDSPRPAAEFEHQVPAWKGRCAAWLNVPYSAGKERRIGTSRARPAEVSALCEALVEAMRHAPDESFGVITFYAAQRDAIYAELTQMNVGTRVGDEFELNADLLGTTRHSERLRIGTVDAFQGREFDVVFLSVVRSNDAPYRGPEDTSKKFGHLGLENRMCVALSRQSKLLVVVGDREMFSHTDMERGLDALRRFSLLADAEAAR